MPNYFYYQQVGGEEQWRPVPAGHREKLEIDQQPVFITVLAVSKLVEDLSYEDKLNLAYEGPMYFDWDSEDEKLVIEKVNQFLDKLVEMKVNLEMCRLFATGGRGYHLEIPQQLFMDRVPKQGTKGLPSIYREVALELCVDTLDLKIYSSGKGRMWRTSNVKRTNGRYKVPITVQEMREMTPELCQVLTSESRKIAPPHEPRACVDLMVLFDKSAQRVEELLKKRKSFKPDPKAKAKAAGPSIQWMQAGLGIKEGAGFQQIATQLAIAATTAGTSEDQFIAECAGLISSHKSDGNRYNSESKRTDELRRMHRYMDGNMCYEFSVGAIKSLLIHSAPDLDGIAVSSEEVKEIITEAVEEDKEIRDEYSDVARGITLAKHGIYMNTDDGKKRICAISFTSSSVLRSSESCQIIGYETDVLVNGQSAGRQTLEVEVFSGLVPFNRFASKYGHAFQGTDAQVRTVMMRFVEQAKKKGTIRYVVKREGLDVVSIPHHENPLYHTPFLVWADANGVIMEPRIRESGLELTFAGFPDPRGVYKTDIAQAPALSTWIKQDGNRELLRSTMENLMTCQKPEYIGKVLGWHVACFYKQIFHKVYGKFPLLHVNGAAGLGKCHKINTPIIMADGSVKMVQDISVGEQLLGPDGRPRNVLSLGRGREPMYRVTPVKGEPYVVNASHILSLKKSGSDSCMLADGTKVPAAADVVNVNGEVFAKSSHTARKALKGWRSDALEFNRQKVALRMDPYALGLWLGDGNSYAPAIIKPEHTQAVSWWIAYAQSTGDSVTKYGTNDECPAWYARGPKAKQGSHILKCLQHYNLVQNKHIPDDYKFASIEDRRKLVAGLLDTDGHLVDQNCYDWISKDKKMAEDFTFICRSLGLAAYVLPTQKGIKSSGFVGDYWRVYVSGDTHLLPCLDKKASPRKQIKRVTVTGISVEPVGIDDYYGFTIDGDHLFLLGDFTVTHNTEGISTMQSLFYYQKEPRMLSPSSTTFALSSHLTASSSIPLTLDEYKPHEMNLDRRNAMKLLFRDAYNQRPVTRGGGSRESEDYRALHENELAAPMVFIAEAAEDEAAVMERVVLATVTRPSPTLGLKWLMRYQAYRRNHQLLGILGQYLAAQIVHDLDLKSFQEEFDALYETKRQRYMLNEEDLKGNLDPEVLKDKQNAKERSVYNHTVATYGFQKFRALVNEACGTDLDDLMETLEEGVFARMSDLHAATTPEYLKVLMAFSTMTYHVESERPESLREGHEYAFIPGNGTDCMELAIRPAYLRYRSYCKNNDTKPLYASEAAFMHAVKDSSAFVRMGSGVKLPVPGVYTFDVEELAKLGVDLFKSKG